MPCLYVVIIKGKTGANRFMFLKTDPEPGRNVNAAGGVSPRNDYLLAAEPL
jgi:hypothetical protein